MTKMALHFGPLLSSLTNRETSRHPCLLRRVQWIYILALVVAATSTTRTRNSVDDEVHVIRHDNVTRVQSETRLYKLIKAREWISALEHLRKNSSEASVLIERRGIDGGVMLRHYPLHQALVMDIPEHHHNVLLPRTIMSEDQLTFMETLLSSYPSAATAADLQRRTPLHLMLYSAILPPAHLVEAMIEAHPKALSARDRESRLPLHAAAYHPMTSYENFLTVYNAHPGAASAMDEDEAYPLHLLSWGGNYADALPILQILVQHDIASLLTKDGDEETPLTLMAKYGKTSSDALRFVLRHQQTEGVHMNRDEYEGNTVLHFAASASHGPNNTVLGPLLEFYPRLAQQINRIGMLPLHTALWKCCAPLHIVELLLETYPQAASLKDGTGYLPLHYACQEGVSDPQIVQLLVDTAPAMAREGAILHPDKIEFGPLPLHLALGHTIKTESSLSKNAQKQLMEHVNTVIAILLRAYGQGARIQEPDSGLLPLHLAILSGRPLSLISRLTQLYPQAVSNVVSVPPDIVEIGTNSSALHLFMAMAPQFYDSSDANRLVSEPTVRDIVMAFLLHDSSLVTRTDDQGRIPLHNVWHALLQQFDASWTTVTSLVQALLEANPNLAKMVDNDNQLPLSYACRARDRTSARLLLSLYPEGAQFKSKTLCRLPLHEACRTQSRDLLGLESNSSAYDEWNEYVLELIRTYPTASSQTDKEGNLPLHNLCQSVAQDKISTITLGGLIDAFPLAPQIPGSNGLLPLHEAILSAISSDSMDDAPYIVGQVRLLLDVYPAGASMTDGQGRTALARLFRSMKTLSALRELETDPLLEIARLLYQHFPEAVLEKDGKGRNGLHFGAVLVGYVGGALTEGWALFLQDIVHDYPELLAISDGNKRTPLHLLMLYLGDTAIGDREGETQQQERTRELSSTLHEMIESMLELYPEALDLQEQYGLTPYELITHARLKVSRGAEVFARSPIIAGVSQTLRRGRDFWSLVHRLRKLEEFDDPVRMTDATSLLDDDGNNCRSLKSELLHLQVRITGAFESNAHSEDLDETEPEPGEVSACTSRQRRICEACPHLSELLATISIQLSSLARLLDNHHATRNQETN
jgi:ankyrin repeat protein